MKPDWKDAPEWANWLAMDADGEWFWFANEPKWLHHGVWAAQGGVAALASESEGYAEKSKERRHDA